MPQPAAYPEPKLREHTLLCIVACLFPLVGAGAGVYGLTREDRAWRNTGRAMLIWALVSTVAWFVIAIPAGCLVSILPLL